VSTPILAVSDLWAGYGDAPVIRGLGVTVEPGEVAVIIGPNGHGKTTLLRAVSGLLKPTRGEVLLDGQPTAGRTPEYISGLGLVHVPQGDGLFAEMTVEENLLMGAFPASSWRGRRRALARAYELFPGVRDRAGQRARTLSGGERRLTALARGLMRQSRIMLIDEPSLGLAPVAIDHRLRGDRRAQVRLHHHLAGRGELHPRRRHCRHRAHRGDGRHRPQRLVR
jgi:branched-chain amino acid transport system ATP-binding protein